MTDQQHLRQQIEACLEQERWAEARLYLAELWHAQINPATASYVVARYERLRSHVPLLGCRVALLRSFTVEPLLPLLRAAAFVGGLDLTVQVSGFNTYAQEILDPDSELYRRPLDVAILCVQTRDLAPELWADYADLSAAEVNAAIARVGASFQTWVETFRAHSQAALVVHNLEAPLRPSQGVLDSQSEISQLAAIGQINQELRRLACRQRGVYVLDYDALVARHGRRSWHDERRWLTTRLPLTGASLWPLAEEWLRFIHPLSGKVCKVLVTDLDQTLWGGVLGEDGYERLQCGPEYPGAAYLALQRALLDVHRRGILLAICSKNDQAEALDALARHPGMLLRPEHFVALRINWQDKAENLRQLAAELKLGTDAVAFLDDNPAERARIRAALPEVTVIELPEEPLGYAEAVRSSPVFERLNVSAEDRARSGYYAEQRQRAELERGAASLEDFYRSLEQEVEIALIQPETLARAAQLTQKTNQFNLTTRRYNEQQLAVLAAAPDWRSYTVRVKDRFGDNGLVGVALTHWSGRLGEIDTFLLSCRVIGRTVETALLSFLLEQARAQGIEQLQGWFRPTAKNAVAQDFYPKHQFRAQSIEEQGTLWTIEVPTAKIPCPEWIQLTVVSEGGIQEQER